MAVKVVRAAVAGASTLLGKELVNEIGDSAAAAWDLTLLEQGDDVEGQLASSGDEALVVHALDEGSFAGMDLVFFATPPSETERYLQPALAAGAAVVDLTGGARGRQDFLLRAPWINAGQKPDLTTAGIVTPHPAALMLALVQSRLRKHFGGAALSATVLEPASAFGAAGVDELHQQTVNLLSFQELPKEVFGAQVAFNVQPRPDSQTGNRPQSSAAEIAAEIKELLGGDTQPASVSVHLLQAPVFHGYVVSAEVRLERDAAVDEVRSAVHGGLVAAENDIVPSNQAAVESGKIIVQVEAEKNAGGTFWMTIAGDNLRLAARCGLDAAMELIALRPGTRVQ